MTVEAATSDKKWTALIYLAGDNDLSDEMVWGLQEMKKAASSPLVHEALNLAVLFDPPRERPRRYDFVAPGLAPPAEADGDLERIETTEYSADSGGLTASALVERFLTERIRELPPTEHYLVILSGHGSGAVGDFLADADPTTTLSIPVLGKVLDKTKALLQEKVRPGAKIDILGMDSCQMSAIEVAYEMRGSARYLVASESLVLETGWPYHRVLQAVGANPEGSETEVASAIAGRYLDFYRDYQLAGISTDISVCELDKLDPVADAVFSLARALTAPLARLASDGLEEGVELGRFERTARDPYADRDRTLRDAVVLAHWNAQSYKCDRYVDLYDFAEQLLRFCSRAPNGSAEQICSASHQVMDAVRAAVPLSDSIGADFQHSHGLSIYFPWSSADYLPEYRNLAFAERTRWRHFLEAYLTATIRMRRDQSANVRETKAGEGLVLARNGREVRPEEPRRRPPTSLLAKDVDAGTHRDVDAGTHRDVDAGTHRDVDAGTHRGKACRSTMKNPPEGYYQ